MPLHMALRNVLISLLFILVSVPVFAGPQDGLPEPGEEWDRSTPRRSLRHFLDTCRDNRYDQAAYLLDLRSIPSEQQARVGPVLARKLKFVLDQTYWFDYEVISDEESGDVEDNLPNVDRIAEVPYGRSAIPITMTRVRLDDGSRAWLISSTVIQRVPDMYRVYGAEWVIRYVPPAFAEIRIWEMYLWQWISLGTALLTALIAGWLISFPAIWLITFIARRTDFQWDDLLIHAIRRPVWFLIAALIVNGLINYLKFAKPAQETADGFVGSSLILIVAWTISRFINILSRTLQTRLQEGDTSLQARGMRTQVIVLRRVINIIVFIIAGALILTQFEILRRVGMSLLASAGVAGVVIGLAAQKTIGNVLAGIQLAITQPIRIGDTVIIEGEWGFIEEINLTYIVVKIWDLRRLVVPVPHFLDRPFQNWTKVSPDLLGTIYFYADYSTPVEKVREELERFVKGRDDWDGNVAGVVVTNVTENTVEIRALISAKDATDQWNLRCAVREHLVGFLRDLEGGKYLPKQRIVGSLEQQKM